MLLTIKPFQFVKYLKELNRREIERDVEMNWTNDHIYIGWQNLKPLSHINATRAKQGSVLKILTM